MDNSEAMLKRVLNDENLFSPFRISSIRDTTPVSSDQYRQPDLWITLNWKDKEYPFFVEIKQSTSAATLQNAISQLAEMAKVFGPANPDAKPLLMIPFLSSSIPDILQGTDVSAIDASGNYFLQTPSLLAIRLDRPKKFRDQRGIRNPYKGDSSLVPRALLLEPKGFASNSALLELISKRFGELAPSTVSKALVTLEEDLIVDRSTDVIKLLQPGLLLDKLTENYERLDAVEEYRLRVTGGRAELARLLDSVCGNLNWMWSGESSAERYTPTVPPERFRVYARSTDKNRDLISQYEDKRFFNCILTVPVKNYVFFDWQLENGQNWASELETYLDMSVMDKREREIAEPIRGSILM